jgi:hypothetical protein
MRIAGVLPTNGALHAAERHLADLRLGLVASEDDNRRALGVGRYLAR